MMMSDDDDITSPQGHVHLFWVAGNTVRWVSMRSYTHSLTLLTFCINSTSKSVESCNSVEKFTRDMTVTWFSRVMSAMSSCIRRFSLNAISRPRPASDSSSLLASNWWRRLTISRSFADVVSFWRLVHSQLQQRLKQNIRVFKYYLGLIFITKRCHPVLLEALQKALL